MITFPKTKTERIAALLPLVLLVLLFAGCQPNQNGKERTVRSWAEAQSSEQGPLQLLMQVSETEISSAGKVELRLQASVAEGYDLFFPENETVLGDFDVAAVSAGRPALATDGRIEQSHTWTLQPYLAGEYTIPALTVSAWAKGKDDTEIFEAITQPVIVNVTSLLSDNGTVEQMDDILPPMQEPVSPKIWALAAVAGLLALAGLIWLVWYLRNRKKMPPPPIPPHLAAHQALEELLGRNLVAQGQVKLFHGEVSHILRHYIEGRFGLKAPERTTEEFLAELGGGMGRSSVFRPEHESLLKEFLTHCDLVKFAEHLPSEAETGRTIALCRSFIDETAISEK